MHSLGYLIFLLLLGPLLFLYFLSFCVYFFLKRKNFLLQTRSPHMVGLLSAFSVVGVVVWLVEEVYFARLRGEITPYVLALYSHLFVPCAVVPLLFRALQLVVMWDPPLRRKYVRYLRRRNAIAILALQVLVLGVIPFVIHVLVAPEQFKGNQDFRMFGEWRYFLPMFVACLIAQAAQLYHLKLRLRIDDALQLVSELTFTLVCMLLFTVGFFTWTILMDNGVSVVSAEDEAWMRVSHMVLLLQFALFTRTVVVPTVQVYRYIHQKDGPAKNVYNADAKWVRPRSQKTPAANKIHVVGSVAMAAASWPSSGTCHNNTTAGNPAEKEEGCKEFAWMKKGKGQTDSKNGEKWHSAITPGGTRMGEGGDATPSAPSLSPDAKLSTLHDIFRYEPASLLFQEFSRKHLCIESYLFYTAVDDYEHLPAWEQEDMKEVFEFGCAVYSSFISSGSEFECNLPTHIKLPLKKLFSQHYSPNFQKKQPVGVGAAKSAAACGSSKSSGNAMVSVGKMKSVFNTFRKGSSEKQRAAAGAAVGDDHVITLQSEQYASFLALPSDTDRRQVFHAAQDDVYNLLRVNLLLPFMNTPEFGSIKRQFDKEREIARACAKMVAAQQQQQQPPQPQQQISIVPSTQPQSLYPQSSVSCEPPRSPSASDVRQNFLRMPSGQSRQQSTQASPTLNPSRALHLVLNNGSPGGMTRTGTRRSSHSTPQPSVEGSLVEFIPKQGGGAGGPMTYSTKAPAPGSTPSGHSEMMTYGFMVRSSEPNTPNGPQKQHPAAALYNLTVSPPVESVIRSLELEEAEEEEEAPTPVEPVDQGATPLMDELPADFSSSTPVTPSRPVIASPSRPDAVATVVSVPPALEPTPDPNNAVQSLSLSVEREDSPDAEGQEEEITPTSQWPNVLQAQAKTAYDEGSKHSSKSRGE